MGRPTDQTKDRSGVKPLYRFDGGLIEALPYFLYEVSIDKFWKNGFCCVKSRHFKSDRLLKIKKAYESKRFDDYKIVRSITLLGAPYNFIRERNLPVYEHNFKIKYK